MKFQKNERIAENCEQLSMCVPIMAVAIYIAFLLKTSAVFWVFSTYIL